MNAPPSYLPFFTTPTHFKRIEQMSAGADVFINWWQTILANDLSTWYPDYRNDLDLISKNFVDNGMGNLARGLRILQDMEVTASEWRQLVTKELSIVFLVCKTIINSDKIAPELAEEVFHLSGLNIFQKELELRPFVEKKILCIAHESGSEEQIVWRKNTYIDEATSFVFFTYETAFKFFEKKEKPIVGEVFSAKIVYFPGCSYGYGRIFIKEKMLVEDQPFIPRVPLHSFEKWSRVRARIISSRPWLPSFRLLVSGIVLRNFENELFLQMDEMAKKVVLPRDSVLLPRDFGSEKFSLPPIIYILEDSYTDIKLLGSIESGTLTLF